ncbi:MAG: hypothetical protein KatS3mg044_1494 [Rhodothermaceae bacterium]|nr:MAG: hypothetical protein KatS3mg044_1494 [Rhodothermaceae bacterium]
MGKLSIILAAATIVAASYIMVQNNTSKVQTDLKQSERQGQMVAREIARSGHNALLSKARKLQKDFPDLPLADIVAMVNGEKGYVTGTYQGGSYKASIYLTSASTFGVSSTGYYEVNEHEVYSEEEKIDGILGDGVLEVPVPSTLEVTFLESMAGYCSAIYLQRMVPKGNNGHGNNEDGVDSSNPGGSKEGEDTDPTVDDEIKNGNGKGAWDLLEPELIFAPGNNRDGAMANYSTIINPGERVNFILAVDADFNCEKRNDTSVKIDDPMFEYTRDALVVATSDLTDLEEGQYAMIQENPYQPGVWRLAFEDLVFSKQKLDDVKQNGYGTTKWNNNKKTYGGSGWTETDSKGYWKLKDFGHMPDFSDQVIEIRMVPATGV